MGAPRQLAFGLHVHVAVRGADRALAVHNALRSYLPDVAVLAGNAPLLGGPNRPRLDAARRSPSCCRARASRPPWASWEERADYERWVRAGGVFPGAGEPWFELRVHDEHGTIELRVPDTQSTPRGGSRRARVRRRAGSPGWPSVTTQANGCRSTTTSGSPRTAGARCATASTATLLDLDSGEPSQLERACAS